MNREKDNEISISLIGLGTVLLIIGLWFLTYFLLKDLGLDERGTLGDMFGTVNALFSGLAFAGIIITILLQRKELKYQREELKATRKEFVIQNKTLRTQRFENTFFGLINLHNQIVKDIDFEKHDLLSSTSETFIGRDAFQQAFKELRQELKQSEFDIAYKKVYTRHSTDFGHYFRNLYRIIKIIHSTEFVSKEELESKKLLNSHYDFNYLERYKYTSIVRSQLSDFELLILFYNSISKYGKKFKPLIEQYSLLKNLPKTYIENKELLKLYDSRAFKND